ncbi:hypothetical protein AKJ53_01305 [candidate division MSBL1 archaeon SCGC-AAA382F02]|uniref:tRNA (guanine(10)-N(2))-dimethyltransferase n=1 Tax=candidate division MSBL1 archaeon SCGC-AAA382F02 TaxID=1698282 RepID=A0A133VI60_9EURY|nr:hypothetical protein AKJ53_01305 [candidate division MSBL1 archaeon SCGC-AAA382F02]
MNRLTFLLSGEHPTIPSSEVIASLEAENYEHEIIEELDQVLTLRSPDADPYTLSRRLGMCHWIGEHFCSSRPKDLIESIGNSDLIDFLPQSESIAVRVKRIGEHLLEIDTQDLSKKVADKILEAHDYEVDLENPDNEIFVILIKNKCVLTVLRARIDRTEYQKRKPPKRAAVHPSTMQPNFARALVNLARTPREGTFLDPFCGVGGILLEAGLLGAKVIGVDINSELIEGAEDNLRDAGVSEFDLQVKNAKDLEIESVDAIATDPPYGRQASTGGSELEEIYESTLPTISSSLKLGGYLCISAPSELDLEKIIENHPLKQVEKHKQRVHKSLTRNIYVFRRETN